VDYTTETAGNGAGGLRRGVDYAHQIGTRINADWKNLRLSQASQPTWWWSIAPATVLHGSAAVAGEGPIAAG
jgi:hypothetical protein